MQSPMQGASPRVPKSERQKVRQARILQVVREEISEHGFDGITMNDLADRAGVVKKTLYNLYGSKDELLLAAIGEVLGEYRTLPESTPQGVHSIVQSRRFAVRRVAENASYAAAMLQSLMRVPQDHRLVQLLLVDAVSFTREHLSVDVAAGKLTPSLDCDEAARGIVGQGFGVVLLLTRGLVAPADVPNISMRGLLSLLISDARGNLHRWLTDALDELNQPRLSTLTVLEN